MTSTFHFIKITTLSTFILYVLFVGLLTILAVLSWVSWNFVGEWSGRVGLVALLIVALSSIIAALLGLIRR